MYLKRILEKASLNPKRLFLVDGFGAIISFVFLGFVLPKLEALIGMPSKELYYLAFLAICYAIYSFVCYKSNLKNWKPFLKTIAFANLLHCCLTIGLMVYYHQELLALAYLYFIGEIIIVLALVVLEFSIASSENLPKNEMS